MILQTEIDFNRDLVHTRENNSISEGILKANREKINTKCQKVLDLLKQGKRLTVNGALLDYGISSLPRRVLDLKRKGYNIQTDYNEERFAEYYL